MFSQANPTQWGLFSQCPPLPQLPVFARRNCTNYNPGTMAAIGSPSIAGNVSSAMDAPQAASICIITSTPFLWATPGPSHRSYSQVNQVQGPSFSNCGNVQMNTRVGAHIAPYSTSAGNMSHTNVNVNNTNPVNRVQCHSMLNNVNNMNNMNISSNFNVSTHVNRASNQNHSTVAVQPVHAKLPGNIHGNSQPNISIDYQALCTSLADTALFRNANTVRPRGIGTESSSNWLPSPTHDDDGDGGEHALPALSPSSSDAGTDRETVKQEEELQSLPPAVSAPTAAAMPHECPECRKSFKSRSNLATHRRLHAPDCPQCEYCGKKFARKSNLDQHRRTHTKEKPFQCKICSKRYVQRHSLIDHQRVHSGERPYECDLCPKSFRVRHNLVTHRRIHTGEKPYKCTLCERRFSSKSGLNSHLKHRHKLTKEQL